MDVIPETNIWAVDTSQSLRQAPGQVHEHGSLVVSNNIQKEEKTQSPKRKVEGLNYGADVVVEEYEDASYNSKLM